MRRDESECPSGRRRGRATLAIDHVAQQWAAGTHMLWKCEKF